MFKWILLTLIGLVVIFPARAQDDTPTVQDIAYDDAVQDTISNTAFFDWWHIQAAAGDIITATMTAGDGLLPVLGLLNPAGDLVTASPDGQINGSVQIEYTVPSAGQYTLVATRVDNKTGTSTGSYTLDVRRGNPPQAQHENPYEAVTYICARTEIVTAATVEFFLDAPAEAAALTHRITVYGIDGFQPVIQVLFEKYADATLCSTDAGQIIAGDTFTLPGEGSRTITADTLGSVAQLTLPDMENPGIVTIRIGSANGAAGRYMALLEGFTIDPDRNQDLVEMRVGPRAAAATAILVYMVGAANSRVDPFMQLPNDETVTCDDAGRRGCTDVTSFEDAGVTSQADGEVTLSGDRSDAGLRLAPGTPDVVPVVFSSRSGGSHGDYAVVMIGELPE